MSFDRYGREQIRLQAVFRKTVAARVTFVTAAVGAAVMRKDWD